MKKGINIKSCFINIGLVLLVVSVIGIFFIMCNLLGISDNQTYIVKGKVIYNNGHTVTLALNDGWEYNVTNRNDLHIGDICKITFTDETTPENFEDDVIQKVEKISK